MDYELEKQLVEEALAGRWDAVQSILRRIRHPHELDRLTDALDKLAAKVDDEANWRAEKRR